MTSVRSKLFFTIGLLLTSSLSLAWTYEIEQCDSDKMHSLYQGNMVHGQELLSRKDNDDGIHGIEAEMESNYSQSQVQDADYLYSIVNESPVGPVDEETSECFTIRLLQYKHTMVVRKVKPEVTAFLGLREGDTIDFTCKARMSTHLPNCQLQLPKQKKN